jgi:hypothetical protein
MAGFILLMRFVKKLFSMTERQTYYGSWLPGLRVRENGFRIRELPPPLYCFTEIALC